MALEFSRHIFKQTSDIKVHKNLSCVNRIVQCGWTDGRTMTKLKVAVRHVAKVPNKKQPIAVSYVEPAEFSHTADSQA